MELGFSPLPSEPLSPVAFDLVRRRGGVHILAGVDEAGCGPLAGPVVAAAVILDPAEDYPGVGDSKKISAPAREKTFELITAKALAWAWQAVEPAEVDRLNPLGAALAAMVGAVRALKLKPDLVLVDGNRSPRWELPTETVVKGDARSLCIGAASIVAKVTRDRLMLELDTLYPVYGFAQHKGYGTAAHLKALRLHGPCPCHRLSFRGVKPQGGSQASLDFGV